MSLITHTIYHSKTHKTFVHFQNTNEDLFDEILEISGPPATTTLTLQKVCKEIVK